jgi:diguanylate cyclase (GGDEF)-like protein
MADLYVHEGQPRKALVLLDRIKPDVAVSDYELIKLAALVSRAKAFIALGDDGAARKAALAVVQRKSSGSARWLKDAYEVLYRIEKKQGNAAAALDYYEKYTALDKAYLSDVNARTLAYETVQQHVLAQKLETEQLSRQNASLRLQQKLAAKTAEANRLYIVLLAMALGFGVFGMIRLKRSQLRYRRLSRLDGLTELLNRQHFMIDAEVVLQRLCKRGGAACLAYLDLDHFKRINDTHGHAAGDTVLREVVAACRQQLRSVDLFGRLGGEEFGILLVDASREQALAIADRIRQAVAASPVAFGDGRIAVSISIGLAFTDSSGHELQHLCMDADAALYLAKDSGRNCVVADGGASSPAPA